MKRWFLCLWLGHELWTETSVNESDGMTIVLQRCQRCGKVTLQ